MNILILTAKFGMGHYNVAMSLKEELEKENVNVEIIDFFDMFFPKTVNLIYNSFNILVSKWSKVYNFFYRFSTKKSFTPLNKVTTRKFDRLISEKKVDIIISTFPVCSNYISKYKKNNNPKIKLYTYITDINANKEWITDETDSYFVASQETKNQLVKYGIQQSKIIINGIPIKREFKNNIYSNEKDNNEIVIMGGGLGIIPQIDKILKELIKKEKLHITLLAGKNKKLFNKYNNKYENVTVVGYTDEVHKYMGKANLLISKAGGITLFEAINSATPIYSITPFLSQEIGNAIFIEENDIGKVMWQKGDNIVQDILNVLEEKSTIENMKNNMSKIKDELENKDILDIYKKEMAISC